MDESFGGPPFAGELVEKADTIEGVFTKVKEFTDDPRWIVKEVNSLDPDYYEKQTKGPINFETFRDQVGKSSDLLAKDDLIDASLDFYFETRKDLHLGPGFDSEIGYLPDLVSTKMGKTEVPNYLTNIMIGKRVGDIEEKVYFTDIYPLVPIYGGAKDKYWHLLNKTLENTETKFGQVIFTQSREKLSRILNPETNQIPKL